MNGKELYELLTYFYKKRNEAVEMREAYKNQESGNPEMQEYYEKRGAEAGMEVSWLDYMIRLFEQKAKVIFE